jgi:hypothetical protein
MFRNTKRLYKNLAVSKLHDCYLAFTEQDPHISTVLERERRKWPQPDLTAFLTVLPYEIVAIVKEALIDHHEQRRKEHHLKFQYALSDIEFRIEPADWLPMNKYWMMMSRNSFGKESIVLCKCNQ